MIAPEPAGLSCDDFIMSVSAATRLVGKIHAKLVFGRRTAVLTNMLAQHLRPSQAVLDIGCGDGTIGALLQQRIPGLEVCGVETHLRPECGIPCRPYDGSHLPFPDAEFDVCLLVDVLHHTREIGALLNEAARVSRAYVLIKDHLDENFADHITLKLMDWVGNRPHGVRLPYNYQSRRAWAQHFAAAALTEVSWTEDVPLYPAPVSWIAGRRLHFVALLRKKASP